MKVLRDNLLIAFLIISKSPLMNCKTRVSTFTCFARSPTSCSLRQTLPTPVRSGSRRPPRLCDCLRPPTRRQPLARHRRHHRNPTRLTVRHPLHPSQVIHPPSLGFRQSFVRIGQSLEGCCRCWVVRQFAVTGDCEWRQLAKPSRTPNL